jgi:AcrR family transcriptional regulator
MARTSAAQSADHEARLLAAGRSAFLKHGYVDALNDVIAHWAGLTRGALHYRFGDKRGLFLAVIRREVEALAARLYARTMAAAPSELEELTFGGEILLEELSAPETGRLLLDLAPAVLTRSEWEELVEKLPLELIEHALGHWADAWALERACPNWPARSGARCTPRRLRCGPQAAGPRP